MGRSDPPSYHDHKSNGDPKVNGPLLVRRRPRMRSSRNRWCLSDPVPFRSCTYPIVRSRCGQGGRATAARACHLVTVVNGSEVFRAVVLWIDRPTRTARKPGISRLERAESRNLLIEMGPLYQA
jgi:hypothetical protein